MKTSIVAFCGTAWVAAIAAGCSGEMSAANTDGSVSVRDGRLHFADVGVLADTLQSLSSQGRDALPEFESQFAGFAALAGDDDASSALSEIPWPLSAVYNREGVYQVGGDIRLAHGGNEYIIPERNESLLPALVDGADPQGFVRARQLERREVRRVLVRAATPNPASATNARDTIGSTSQALLDARYQSEFDGANGHHYKCVDEAYVDNYADYVAICFRAKFEYKKGRNWLAAGEAVEKFISLARGDYRVSPHGSIESAFAASDYRYDNQYLVTCTSVTPRAGSCVSGFELYASYSSYLNISGIGEFSYDEWATWSGTTNDGNPFYAIQNCN